MADDKDTTPNGQDKRATRITVTLPPDNYELLVRVARNKKVSASWVVRDAVEKYLAADMPLFTQNPT
ncbi:ribbon-helix-helix domain-containing protein [Fontisphaera persica]|uniref:ribbon-helix-helix domain-containing protein n=1 Tax=Fontisphaera persica TaxID=2974023 RepID=UPI0024BFFB5D|nr:CopG family transcriptional regulator [Fontisphaera persica]WCJ60308.1 ribbon-helix-helix domain-containing protein [Fontisphaera persica]